VEADESPSPSSDDDVKSLNSAQTCSHWQRLRAERDLLRRRLADSRERAWQLELQLAKVRTFLDTANQRLADQRSHADSDSRIRCNQRASAGGNRDHLHVELIVTFSGYFTVAFLLEKNH